ncbi:hypothetical protein PSRA_0985 [Pseudoscardovia radai]|uniref:Uncharacterized protein n=1 Tax=Pseudoscardovia radai TaxID=987066 RepID=A0A261EXL5_9BIFI|nr:hypothetical protein [Pseudoscardovia radai]OZG51588.1 hypothetical protein PSRA_0985 [Pseudoscardovia radai]
MSEHDYSLLDGAAMYDVFYEAGTKLGGRLVALDRQAKARGDEAESAKWRAEHVALNRERAAVDPNDRAAQIAAVKRWNARRAELKGLLYD